MSRWAQYELTKSSRKSGWTVGLKADGWQTDRTLRLDVANYLSTGERFVSSGLQTPYRDWPVGPFAHALIHLGINNDLAYLRFKRKEDALMFKLMSGAG
ncbi:MAG: hypothetical protein FP819_03635 [Rhizobiaceae bacterium]|nr:hypothetical protein [Rhizobiaceae bacterium]